MPNCLLEISKKTPIALRKATKKPSIDELREKNPGIFATHFTVVTTPNMAPEMHDQQEDRYR